MSCALCGKRVRPKQRKYDKIDECAAVYMFCSAACVGAWEANCVLAQLHKYEVMSTYAVPTQIMLQH
jgi:hypothetical protein